MDKPIRRGSALLALALAFLLLTGCVPAGTAAPSATAPPEAAVSSDLVLLTPVPEQEAAGTEEALPPEEAVAQTEAPAPEEIPTASPLPLDEHGVYTSRDDVALYLHLYGHLPENFISKYEARKLGWERGSLEPYAPGKSIGGDRFLNREGLLPEAKGRTYYECDIDTMGRRSRGSKRIIWSNDGLIYYTSDHYESFTLLYGEE